MKPDVIQEKIELPDGVTFQKEGEWLHVKGPKGESKRKYDNPKVVVEIKDRSLLLSSVKPSRREKAVLYTYRVHLLNMIKGASEGFTYELKICASHFPMSVTCSNGSFIVKNFFGEKYPRTLKVSDGVTIKINDKTILVESVDKELAGMTAGNIEQLTRISNRDLRVFQDGIYIVRKAGK